MIPKRKTVPEDRVEELRTKVFEGVVERAAIKFNKTATIHHIYILVFPFEEKLSIAETRRIGQLFIDNVIEGVGCRFPQLDDDEYKTKLRTRMTQLFEEHLSFPLEDPAPAP